MIGYLKQFVPLSLYLCTIACCLLALTGRPKFALLCVTFLLPLRNIVDKFAMYPGGSDLVDLLILSSIFGSFLSSMMNRNKLFSPSSLTAIILGTIFYMYLSVWKGYVTLDYFTPLDFSDDRVQDWKNFVLLPILYFCVINICKKREDIWQMLKVMALSVAVSAYYTANQVTWYSMVSRKKINGTFVFLGPNEVAAFLNVMALVAIAFFFVVKGKKIKLFLAGLITVKIFCILFLFSRAAYMGLVAGCTLLFAFKKPWLLVPLFIVAVFWESILPHDVIVRITETTDEYGQLEESAEHRVLIWQDSIDLWQQDPVFGIGFGAFRKMGLILGDTHNIYLKILSEQGLVGILFFALLIFGLIREGLRLVKMSKEELAQGLGYGLAFGVVVILVNNFFGDRWTYLEMAAYYWIIAGLTTSMINILKNNSTSEISTPPSRKKKIKRSKTSLPTYIDPERTLPRTNSNSRPNTR